MRKIEQENLFLQKTDDGDLYDGELGAVYFNTDVSTKESYFEEMFGNSDKNMNNE